MLVAISTPSDDARAAPDSSSGPAFAGLTRGDGPSLPSAVGPDHVASLRIALWPGEEQGLLGSHTYTERAARDPAPFRDCGQTAILGIEDLQDLSPRFHAAGDPLQDLDMHCFADLVKASLATVVHLGDCRMRPTYLPVVARDG